MKQPKLKVTDLQGNDVGVYNVLCLCWNRDGSNIIYVTIESIISGEHMYFWNEKDGFIEHSESFKGELIYE